MDVGKGTGSICFSSPLIFFGLSFFLAFIPPAGKGRKTEGEREKSRRIEERARETRGAQREYLTTAFRVALSPRCSHTVIINGTVTPYS